MIYELITKLVFTFHLRCYEISAVLYCGFNVSDISRFPVGHRGPHFDS